MSLTWSKGGTCSGGDGNALPTPKRETERYIRMEGRDKRSACVYECRHACIWEQARLEILNWKGQQMRQEEEIN